jgi:hypothetical protein
MCALSHLALLQPTISCPLLRLAIPQPTVFCTLPADIQPIIRRSTLPVKITTDRSALSCVTPTDYLLCSSHSGDTKTEHPLYFACRYYNGLSALRCLSMVQSTIRSALSVDITTEYPLYRLSVLLSLTVLKSVICCDLLDLSILQPTFLCALFHSVCHHYNRLSALLRDSDGIVSERERARTSDNPLSSVRRRYF